MEDSTLNTNALHLQNISSTPGFNYRSGILNLPFKSLYIGLLDVIWPLSVLLLAFGIAGNILNVIVFTKLGAKDNVTVSFLALTVSDLMHLVLMVPHIVTRSLEHIVEYRLGVSINWLVDPFILRIPFYWYAFVFYETSILITVYIAVVRCACVAMPLKVKSTFTFQRAVIAFVAFFISMALLRVPVFMSKRIVREWDKTTNTTRVVYRLFDDGGVADMVNDIVSRNILTWTSFVIIVCCVVVMATKLRASAKFRSSASTTARSPSSVKVSNDDVTTRPRPNLDYSEDNTAIKTQTSEKSKQHPVLTQKNNFKYCVPKTTAANNRAKAQLQVSNRSVTKINSPSSDKSKKHALSARETQVVRSVVLVAGVFITCQIPFMTYSLVRRFEPEFDVGGPGDIKKYAYLFLSAGNISKLFSTINASVNILVYYNFNSRYRQCMKCLRSKSVK